MKKLAIVTSTRADYGLLYPIISEFRSQENSFFTAKLIVTGTHLSDAYGMTINEIKADEVRIDHIVNCSSSSISSRDIARNISETITSFTDLFLCEKFDAVLLLGDRYEILGVACAATICNLPIFHIGGGDTTEGAIDESIRHSITKMSILHFTTNEISRKRVIQLGEDPKRVYNVGSTSIDNMLHAKLMDKKSVLDSIGLDECDYALCTYHPETLSEVDCRSQIEEFIDGLSNINLQFIITKSNADLGGKVVNDYLDSVAKEKHNIHVFPSLGRIRYLSLMKYAKCVIGNSSSGIVETPSFGIPTINIGDRQKGRLYSPSIINTKNDAISIENCINSVLNNDIKKEMELGVNPYGDGESAKKIVELSLLALENEISLKKKFFDVYFII